MGHGDVRIDRSENLVDTDPELHAIALEWSRKSSLIGGPHGFGQIDLLPQAEEAIVVAVGFA